MKQIFAVILLMAALALPAAAETAGLPEQKYITAPEQENTLIDNKIYFFAHSLCQSCRDAFIYFEEHHPELNIGITDMKFHHNLELYKLCVKKFNIKNSELRLPLICMGNSYIMGWNRDSGTLFEEHLRNFQNKAKQ